SGRERFVAPRLGPARGHPQARKPCGDHGPSRLSEPKPSLWSRVGSRTRGVLAAGLRSLTTPLASGYYDELEEVLIAADLGPAMAARLTAGVRSRAPPTHEEAAEAPVALAYAVLSKQPPHLDLASNPARHLPHG